jgi:cytochrome c oxidase subunit 2
MHVSVFNPESPQAAELLWLWDVCMWVCGFILAFVTLAILYIVVRYRQRGNEESPQVAGNKKLEIIWTLIPLALVGFLFFLSIRTARAVDRPIRREPDIVVTGHQWWWEVGYPAANASTANEVHVPVGRDMLPGIEAADVIHDFWVPRLRRKIDAIPGRRNFIWLRADQVGDYFGACAEYCGAQHAWMRFRVVAQEPAAYALWLNAQAAPATPPVDNDARLGIVRFGELTCASCHNVRGINSQKQYGPDLTHVASRRMLAAERLENTPGNLRRWLRQPDLVKPNCEMPNLKLSDEDLTTLTALLESLK